MELQTIIPSLRRASTTTELGGILDYLPKEAKFCNERIVQILLEKQNIVTTSTIADNIVKILSVFSSSSSSSSREILRSPRCRDFLFRNVIPNLAPGYSMLGDVLVTLIGDDRAAARTYSTTEVFQEILSCLARAKSPGMGASSGVRQLCEVLYNILSLNPASVRLLNALPFLETMSAVVPHVETAGVANNVLLIINTYLKDNESAVRLFHSKTGIDVLFAMESMASNTHSPSVSEATSTLWKAVFVPLQNASTSAHLTSAVKKIPRHEKYYSEKIRDSILQKRHLISDSKCADAVIDFLKAVSSNLNSKKLLKTKQIRDLVVAVLAPQVTSGDAVYNLGGLICETTYEDKPTSLLYSTKDSLVAIVSCFRRASTVDSANLIASALLNILISNPIANKLLNDIPTLGDDFACLIPIAATNENAAKQVVWALEAVLSGNRQGFVHFPSAKWTPLLKRLQKKIILYSAKEDAKQLVTLIEGYDDPQSQSNTNQHQQQQQAQNHNQQQQHRDLEVELREANSKLQSTAGEMEKMRREQAESVQLLKASRDETEELRRTLSAERAKSLRSDQFAEEVQKLKRRMENEHLVNRALKEEIEELKKQLEREKNRPQFPRVKEGFLDLSKKTIGSGATSRVHETSYLGTPAAVKMFLDHVSKDRTLQRELKAASHLRHPNIVSVLSIVEDDHDSSKVVGLVMEMMSVDLHQQLESSPNTSIRQRLQWCLEAAQGIFCAHSLGVIHSDIKPENVLLSTSNPSVAKLTDFGCAHVLSTNATNVTAARGTPLYIAPEYADGTTGPTKQSDVFAFGMMLWSVLHPGVDHGLGKTAIQIGRSFDKEKRPGLDGTLPAEIRAILEKCWHQDPTKRPNIEETIQVLDDVVQQLEGCVKNSFEVSPIWTSDKYLKNKYSNVGAELSKLKWSPGADATTLLFSNDVTDPQHPLFQFVASKFRPTAAVQKSSSFPSPHYRFSHQITRISFVAPDSKFFLHLHDEDNRSRSLNSYLNLPPTFLVAQQQQLALQKLASVFEDSPNSLDGAQNNSRILFGWHGCGAGVVEKVCRDGVRGFRETDPGFFGAGSYFSLEADYVAPYSEMSGSNSRKEHTMILFAISVSQAYPVTLEKDYRPIENAATPHLHGFSNFYSGDNNKSVALMPRCDCHFVPTKPSGHNHPLKSYRVKTTDGKLSEAKSSVMTNLLEQACNEDDPDVVGHEIVLHSHTRALPVAVVYFK